ncbi:MAG: hypothetical protein IPL28_22650 [Chloroflexi bacterium]|nr:hypothetical protein [Chloroflexota bacterium]
MYVVGSPPNPKFKRGKQLGRVKENPHCKNVQCQLPREQATRARDVRLLAWKESTTTKLSSQCCSDILRDADLDLVEVAPNPDPPVCRIMILANLLMTKRGKSVRRGATKRKSKRRRFAFGRKSLTSTAIFKSNEHVAG